MLVVFGLLAVATIGFFILAAVVVDRAAEGHYAPHIFRAFAFEEVREAHQMMEDSAAAGKLVVLT